MRITVGTTPTLLLNPNPRRRYFLIQFISTSIDAGNTGIVFIGRGQEPTADPASANSGEMMTQGSALEELKSFDGDPRPYKGAIWAISDTASQELEVQEDVDPDILPE